MKKNITSEKPFLVRRGRVDSVNLYEVKEDELDVLESGESTTLQLNFAIFLLSIAFAAITTLCTASFTSPLISNVYLFVAILGIIIGSYILLMWWKGRKSIKSVIKTIKNRIPPDNLEDTIDEDEFNIETENLEDSDFEKPQD